MTTTTSTPKSQNLILTSTWENGEVAATSSIEQLFMASISAPAFESEERSSRSAIDIVCVIDKSGSMSGAKIELVKKTLNFMVEQLKHDDRVALVSFDTEVNVEFDLLKMDDKGKQTSKSIIEKVQAGTCTNLSGGLFQGFELLKKRETSSEVASILLFTDGLANAGITQANLIVSGIEKTLAELGKACTLFTFGYGQDHDANMLTRLAQAGNGLYYFVQQEDEIPESFANCLGGLLSVVAQNIKLTVEAVNGAKIVKIHASYKKNEIDKDKKFEIQVGDLYSEEKRDIMFTIQVPALTQPEAVQNIVQLDLKYFNVVSTSLQSVQCVCTLQRPDQVSPLFVPNLELDKQHNRIISAEALAKARDMADKNQLLDARKLLTDAIKRIEQSHTASNDYCKGLIKDLQDCLMQMEDQQSYTTVGSKMLNNYWASNTYQRQTSSKSAAQDSYTTSAKKSMASKFSALKK